MADGAESSTLSSLDQSNPGGSPQEDGLGYSRHYAQRIRDLGKTSKESWIKRLWNHMFGVTAAASAVSKTTASATGTKESWSTEARASSAKEHQSSSSQSAKNPVPVVYVAHPTNTSTRKTSSADNVHSSVNIASKEREKEVRFVEVDHTKSQNHAQEYDNGGSAALVVGQPTRSVSSRERTPKQLPTQLINSPYLPSNNKLVFYKPTASKPPRDDGVAAAKQRYEKLSKSSTSLGSASMPNIKLSNNDLGSTGGSNASRSQPSRSTRPSTRDVTVVQREKRAKTIADRAMKSGKVFTCNAPYPVDVFVRYSLRQRGWVEKFGPRVMSQTVETQTTDGKLQCVTDEDFEAVCFQSIPKPWEEEHGMYTIMSRYVQRCPPKFIWAGKSINSVVLKSDVIVNHFPKARYFSSKVLLTTSLKELPWQNNTDPMSFFPRCYILNDDDKADIIDDFQLTACISLLKLVVNMHRNGEGQLNGDSTSDVGGPDEDGTDVTDSLQDTGETETVDDVEHEGVETDGNVAVRQNVDGSDIVADIDSENVEAAGEEEGSNQCAADITDDDQDQIRSLSALYSQQKVVPDLESVVHEKKGGNVPSKAVDWALQHCDRYIRSRNHEDIDKFRRGLTSSQWEQLLNWFYQVSLDGATVDVSDNKLTECENVLRKISHLWPQFDIDGVHNIWIVKPGDKSKGIGIAFCDNLEKILKYISDPNTQDYIVQKYIERPLLIYKCKFDVRQWFIVSDWSPLTIWFYKDSYLRICSQEFSYDCMHESIHLSNVAVQENYVNGKRSEKLPENNFMTSEQFKEYLSEIGAGEMWEEKIYPGMKAAVINTMVATQEFTDTRKSAFELYGADFMMSEDYRPWLLEVNSSPGMLPSSIEKAKLCASVINDTIKVVLDHRENCASETGRFELVHHDSTNPNTRGLDTRFIVEGQRIKRPDLQRYSVVDQKAMKIQKERENRAKEKKLEAKKAKEEAAIATSSSAESSMVNMSEASSETSNRSETSSAGNKSSPSSSVSPTNSQVIMCREISICEDVNEDDEMERFAREQLELMALATAGTLPPELRTKADRSATQATPTNERTAGKEKTNSTVNGLRKSTFEIYTAGHHSNSSNPLKGKGTSSGTKSAFK